MKKVWTHKSHPSWEDTPYVQNGWWNALEIKTQDNQVQRFEDKRQILHVTE